jgi:hypothetical protein
MLLCLTCHYMYLMALLNVCDQVGQGLSADVLDAVVVQTCLHHVALEGWRCWMRGVKPVSNQVGAALLLCNLGLLYPIIQCIHCMALLEVGPVSGRKQMHL